MERRQHGLRRQHLVRRQTGTRQRHGDVALAREGIPVEFPGARCTDAPAQDLGGRSQDDQGGHEKRATKAEPATPPPAATELAKANIRTAEAEPSAVEDATVDENAAAASPNTSPRAGTTLAAPPKAPAPVAAAPARTSAKVVVRDVKRLVLPEVVRVTIELDGEVAYHEEALQNPSRLFFDLRGASLAPTIEEGVKSFADGDVVREIRLGTHPGGVTRVVVDTQGVARHSLFTLYNPYRLVLDMYREPALSTQKGPPPSPAGSSARLPVVVPTPPKAGTTTAVDIPPECAAACPSGGPTSRGYHAAVDDGRSERHNGTDGARIQQLRQLLSRASARPRRLTCRDRPRTRRPRPGLAR